MNEQEKTPLVSHHTATKISANNLREPPFDAQDVSNDSTPSASASLPAAAAGATKPSSLTIDNSENRMSGLSNDDSKEEDEEQNTPKSCVAKRLDDLNTPTTSNSFTGAAATNTAASTNAAATTTSNTAGATSANTAITEHETMPPVQEYSVLTYNNNSGLPPRSSTKLRSPRLRSVKAVDWCPPTYGFSRGSGGSGGGRDGAGGREGGRDGISNSGRDSASTAVTVTTSRAVRGDDATITTYATMTTMGDAASILEGSEDDDESRSEEESVDEMPYALNSGEINSVLIRQDGGSVISGMDLGSIYEHCMMEGDVSASGGMDMYKQNVVEVDKVPDMTSTLGTSVISGATSKALRGEDVDSVYSLGTGLGGDYNTQKVIEVDKVPDMTSTGTSVSGATSKALRDQEDRSLFSLTTANTLMNGNFEYQKDGTVEVDKVPSIAGSVVSGTTTKAIRDPDDRSLFSLNTTNTLGMNMNTIVKVDKVPSMTSTPGTSVISGTTSKALRDPDDRSLYSLNTTNTTGIISEINTNNPPFDYQKNTMVDRTPSNVAVGNTQQSLLGDEDSDATFSTMNTTGRERAFSNVQTNLVDHVPDKQDDVGSTSAKTDGAVRNKEDQSVATWNTFTTSGNNAAVVDVLPTGKTSVVSGTTNHAVNEDQSVATWNTMTTAPTAVDRVPSTNVVDGSISGATNRAVRAPDDQSVVTFATQTTFGERGRVVDHIPSISQVVNSGNQSVTSENNTDYAIGGSQSVATWTTMNTVGNNQLTGNVVDRIPSFVVEENVSSAMSAPTANAVQEDRSVTTFTTTTTAGERGIQHVVDGVPTFAGGGGRSVASGITNQAVRMNDDRSIASFNTMTTSGDLGSIYERGNEYTEDAADEDRREEDDEVATSVSSSSRPIAPSGILREGRHNRPSGGVAPAAASASAFVSAGESVSNTHILRAITELRLHVDYRMEELGQTNHRDLERVVQIIQQEQMKRTALEQRLHSQLLMQSESMVAMELKLLRLEAKVAHRELHRQRRQPGMGSMPVTDRLPPIAATSSPNRSDEEVDSFEELDLTPRANRQGVSSSSFSQGGVSRGPANIAVVTRSGASVASAVTATSFADGDFTHLHDEEERSEGSGSEDGDVEDMDDHNDGSASTPHSGSNNRISNLESILLNPLTPTGSQEQGVSTRAVRGETDGNSSLPTSVTSTTMASTVVTATTRGDSVALGITRMSSRTSEEDLENIREHNEATSNAAAGTQGGSITRFHSDDMIDIDGTQQEHARSRSQSPLTVQSAATETIGTQSIASVSVVPSILSTAAVASSRSFGTRRANAAMAALERNVEGRPLANRVVSFTTNDMEEQSAPIQENDGGGDSITMPDELDTFSDVADAFSNSARVWREEYEARLSNLEKRLGN